MSADDVFWWANWALLAALLLGVAATYAIIVSGNIKEANLKRELHDKDDAFDRFKLATDKQIAEANARALEAQAELARFKAPRSILALSKFAGTDAAIYVLGEGPEPNGLAASIGDVLTQSHWTILSWNWSGAGAATGIIVLFKPGSAAEIESACDALVTALNSVHIASAKETWPGDWEHFGGMLNGPQSPGPTAAPIRIVIGSKPQ